MSVHFNLSLYWLLLPLAVGLWYWAFTPRADERSSSWAPDLGVLIRMAWAALIFVVVLCVLLGVNLWLSPPAAL